MSGNNGWTSVRNKLSDKLRKHVQEHMTRQKWQEQVARTNGWKKWQDKRPDKRQNKCQDQIVGNMAGPKITGRNGQNGQKQWPEKNGKTNMAWINVQTWQEQMAGQNVRHKLSEKGQDKMSRQIAGHTNGRTKWPNKMSGTCRENVRNMCEPGKYPYPSLGVSACPSRIHSET